MEPNPYESSRQSGGERPVGPSWFYWIRNTLALLATAVFVLPAIVVALAAIELAIRWLLGTIL